MKTFLLKEIFKDNRGVISSIMVGGKSWREINMITTKKGVVRGNHFHKETEEFLFLMKGKIQLDIVDAKTNEKFTQFIEKNQGVVIEPYEYHTITTLEDTTWIAALTVCYNPKNPDMHQLG